jgi:geranylgeranyl diphosphate synthase, type II
MMNEVNTLQELIEKEIRDYSGVLDRTFPYNLYHPLSYALRVGGKRIRPLMVLMGYQLFSNKPENALKAAVAIELFHNFTLMHDDIMDKAEMRRNQPSVHKKFDENTAILSGDVMAFMAYGLLMEIKSDRIIDIVLLFTRTAKEICEGQQMDMDFESRLDVTVEEYLEMIRLKTAVLMGCSLKTGGLLGNCDETTGQALYEAGINFGLAFQLMDDLLDTFGEEKNFGKNIGGDIVTNKKTFLLVESLQKAPGNLKQELQSWLKKELFNREEKIRAVRSIYDKLGIKEMTENKINVFTARGIGLLEDLTTDNRRKEPLISLVRSLTNRNS